MKLRLACRSVIGLCGLVLLACGGQPAGATGTGATGSGTTARGATVSGTPGIGTTSGPTALPADRVPAGDWTQFDYDAQRSGTGPSPTGIRAGNLGRLRLRTVRVDGIVDSSAVELHSVFVDGARHDLVAVTTSYGRTIAIDPRTGRRLWEFRPSGVNGTPGNPQVTTASPIVDPDRRYLYSASPNGVIHMLAVSNGRQVWQ
ncbi:MAG: PQQ-binding-like beta-propeller repeat protein, partial [Solirubrobacteraceae bacterium]